MVILSKEVMNMAKIFLLKSDSKKISEINISDFINLFENKYEYIYDEPFGGIPKEEMLKVKVSIPNILLGKTGKATKQISCHLSEHAPPPPPIPDLPDTQCLQ